MGEGASQLVIPIIRALPQPPDIAVLGQVPGGILTRSPPWPGGGDTAPLLGRDYRIKFPVQQGTALSINRIHVAIAVFLSEVELEKQVTVEIAKTKYETNAEREAVFKGKGGHVTSSESHVAIGPNRAFEHTTQTKAFVGFEGELVLLEETVTTTERSVLPITVAVVARLIGPDGEAWSQAFEVPIRYVLGNPGGAWGTGAIDAYADLNNAIAINPSQPYSLALSLLVPSSVKTNPQLGPEVRGAEVVFGGPSAVTLFYDVETVPVGK